jgi:hypothetical protein
MFGCRDAERAIASFPKQPFQTIRFIGWDGKAVAVAHHRALSSLAVHDRLIYFGSD